MSNIKEHVSKMVEYYFTYFVCDRVNPPPHMESTWGLSTPVPFSDKMVGKKGGKITPPFPFYWTDEIFKVIFEQLPDVID